MFKIDMRTVKALESKLGDLNRRGIPFANKNTINDLAFATQKESRKTIEREFITRNRWTVGSIRVDRAKSTRDSAEVGSIEQYMADQEFGASGGPVNVPTTVASGEAPRAKQRLRPVRRANRMTSIKLGKRQRTGSKKQQNIIAVKEAAESKQRYVFLDRGRTKGIYRITGGKRKPRVRMVQNLTRTQRIVPRTPWLAPSTAAVEPLAPRIYARRLSEQLRRLK